MSLMRDNILILPPEGGDKPLGVNLVKQEHDCKLVIGLHSSSL